MNKLRATRHNGRKGENGIFKAGHNDRTFNLENAEHIDPSKSIFNVYWDCYQGFNIADEHGKRPERKFNFDEIEHTFYYNKFIDSVDAQNERHIRSRHKERCRDIDGILKDPKTCPEETVYQLGTKDGYADPALFARVGAELFEEMEKRYGANLHILDWALHMDESTPHIHERHVFFAKDNYGFLFPKQDRACQELGFEVPNPDKKPSKFNSRKMSFDAEIRALYIEIAEKYGITIEKVPLEGKEHLEKNDYIISKQTEEIAHNNDVLAELSLKISDAEQLLDDIAKDAYEKACDVVSSVVMDETQKEDAKLIDTFEKHILESDNTPTVKRIAKQIITGIKELFKKSRSKILTTIQKTLSNPEIKEKSIDQIKESARSSVLDRLTKAKKLVSQESHSNSNHNPIHSKENERN